MTLQNRSFNWDKDFELVRDFLGKTYPLKDSHFTWVPSRFENRKACSCGTEYQDEEDKEVTIWEEIDKIASQPKIIAVLAIEKQKVCWLQIHPKYRFYEEEIIHWIEEQRKKTRRASEEPELNFYVLGTDTKRINLLSKLDYKNLGFDEYNRNRPLELPVSNYDIPNGFHIRNVNITKDFVKYREVISTVFPHCNKMTERIFEIFTSASFYNEKLDIIAVAPNGDFAAFCTVRLDPKSKIVELEPVGTHPKYRRLGLAKAVINEALIRLKEYNPSVICIPGAATTEGANRLYDSLGFTEKIEVYYWQKKF